MTAIGFGLMVCGACVAPLAGAPRSVRIERRVALMGTYATLEVGASSREDALAASEAALRALEDVETRLSTWTDDSELARFNAAPADRCVRISRALDTDLRACRELVAATEGAFDPTVGALVRAWDLRGAGVMPDDATLARERLTVGFERGCIEDADGWRRAEGVILEEGAFGKGVGLEAALATLRELECDAVLDLGGQVASLDRTLDWRIADPRDRSRAVLVWRIESGSVATSGASENSRWIDGHRVGHILDPRSGRPAVDFGSASVWCESAVTADAYSTALFVMGPLDGTRWATARDDLRFVFLVVEGDSLVARVDERLRGEVEALVADVRVEFVSPNDAARVSRRSRTE